MILVAGGAGFIGSHTCVSLIESGHDVLIADNFFNSSKSVIERIGRITGKNVPFVEADLADRAAVKQIFKEHDIDGVIMLAGYKAVGESVAKPLMYYRNNLDICLSLLEVMAEFGAKKLIFSSSATVYDPSNVSPLYEDMKLGCTNPYGWTKYMIEQMLRDIAKADREWRIVSLRYFNPIGAHESGLIGEAPNGIPNNLLPYVAKVAAGELPFVHVYGNDYPTPDGTGVRDYIHVCDLARGHVNAYDFLGENSGLYEVNLGTGHGVSVLEIISAFEKACGKAIPYKIEARRPGDIATCFAGTGRAKELFGWEAEYGIERMCADGWRWQQYWQTLEK